MSLIEIGCGKTWKIPRGPDGEKRPVDFMGNADKVMRAATGEETESAGWRPRSVQEEPDCSMKAFASEV